VGKLGRGPFGLYLLSIRQLPVNCKRAIIPTKPRLANELGWSYLA